MLITFLGFAFGPFVIAPFAEAYGRRPMWILGNIWFILWNAVVPLGKSTGLMISARFMAGVGASANIAVSTSLASTLGVDTDK